MNSKNNNQICAPSKKYVNGSCFDIKDLKLIAKSYNERKNVKNKINLDLEKEELVNQIEKN